MEEVRRIVQDVALLYCAAAQSATMALKQSQNNLVHVWWCMTLCALQNRTSLTKGDGQQSSQTLRRTNTVALARVHRVRLAEGVGMMEGLGRSEAMNHRTSTVSRI